MSRIEINIQSMCPSAVAPRMSWQNANDENKKVILALQEEGKENVSFDVTAFSKNTSFVKDYSQFDDNEKMSYGGFYRKVRLEPTGISGTGFIPEEILSPVLPGPGTATGDKLAPESPLYEHR